MHTPLFFLVYKITNKINGKYYIGVHKTLDKNDNYMGSGILIRRAMKKYGKDNFTKEILYESSNSEDMYRKEKELVVISDQCYNLKLGGCGGWDHIARDRTEEVRRKISLKLKGKTLSNEHRKNQSLGKKGNLNAAKTYKIETPKGIIETVHGLSSYCRLHNLDQGNLTHKKKDGSYYSNKGYRILEVINAKSL